MTIRSSHSRSHRIALCLFALIMLTAANLTPTADAADAPQLLDRVVVIVDDDVITELELEARIEYFMKQIRMQGGSVSDVDSMRKQVLERMIRDRIQLQKAALLGIKIDDVTLNRMLDALASSNKITLSGLRDELAKGGIDFATFREESRNELIIKQLQERLVEDKVTVSEQEIKQFLDSNALSSLGDTTYHLRHILVATPETAKPEDVQAAQNKADNIYTQIQQGEEFDQLAMRESDGSRALQGGDLGTRSANELPQLFLDAIAALKPGQITKPIRSASGFHILQLVESSKSQEMVTNTHARHILIRTGADYNDEEARTKLLELKKDIENGADFATLATEYSQDPGSALKGGDLGWTGPGTFVPAFENTLNSLSDGEISEPFQTQFGWHILQVLGRREIDQTTAVQEAKARQAIKQRKLDEELRLWLRRIRDEAYVEYLDTNLNNTD
jgi:peptidyl-prolyl cis-trans isomerase SurA